MYAEASTLALLKKDKKVATIYSRHFLSTMS
jgi:hypothetical protein